jgi:tRNA pseudouridine13 synthase
LEQQLAAQDAALTRLLESQGLEHERRSLRVPVRPLTWQLDPGTIDLVFELPRGAFATAVLHELLADAWDPAERGED